MALGPPRCVLLNFKHHQVCADIRHIASTQMAQANMKLWKYEFRCTAFVRKCFSFRLLEYCWMLLFAGSSAVTASSPDRLSSSFSMTAMMSFSISFSLMAAPTEAFSRSSSSRRLKKIYSFHFKDSQKYVTASKDSWKKFTKWLFTKWFKNTLVTA